MRALKRGSFFSSRFVRLAVAGLLSWIVLALAWWSLHQAADESHARTTSAQTSHADPVTDAMARCQTLGEAGARDQACLDAWAQNRRRFLRAGAHPTPTAAASAALPAASTEDR
jgi:conjugative transfer region protein TrbK